MQQNAGTFSIVRGIKVDRGAASWNEFYPTNTQVIGKYEILEVTPTQLKYRKIQ
jgi:hypothetical protein